MTQSSSETAMNLLSASQSDSILANLLKHGVGNSVGRHFLAPIVYGVYARYGSSEQFSTGLSGLTPITTTLSLFNEKT